MVEWYHSVYDKASKIEGAAQRVQEDTIKFSRIMESLGTSLIESMMVLFQFIPILLGLSVGIPIYFFGPNRTIILSYNYQFPVSCFFFL